MNPKPRLRHRPASSWKGCLSEARLGCGAHVAVDAGFRQALGSQAGLACPRRPSANSTLGIQHGLRLPEGQDPRLLHPPHPPPRSRGVGAEAEGSGLCWGRGEGSGAASGILRVHSVRSASACFPPLSTSCLAADFPSPLPAGSLMAWHNSGCCSKMFLPPTVVGSGQRAGGTSSAPTLFPRVRPRRCTVSLGGTGDV